MEQSEGFSNVVDTIRALEKQLSLCGDAMRLCEQTALEAEEEVQEHFMRGMRVVLARKVTLGKEIMDKASHQSMLPSICLLTSAHLFYTHLSSHPKSSILLSL